MTLKTLKAMLPLAAAMTLVLSPTPAFAVIETFAQFQPIGTASNIRWDNNGSTSTNGTGGSIFSVSVGTSTVAGSRSVWFSFLKPELAPIVTNVTALFLLNATVPSGNPAQLNGGFLIQNNITGSFQFLSTESITVGGNVYAAGSNLLTGTFGGATIIGPRSGTSGSFSGNTSAGDTLSYTSDFLDFSNALNSDFSISLTQITSALQATPTTGTPTRALRDFRALAGGTFSTDPAPLISAVPEPGTWAMMLLGFCGIGAAIRRKRAPKRANA